MFSLLSTVKVPLAAAALDEMSGHVIHHVLDRREWSPLPGVHLEIPAFLTFQAADLHLGFTLHMAMLSFAMVLILAMVLFGYRRTVTSAPKGLSNALEYLVDFVRNEIAIKNMGLALGRRFTPFFLTLFFLLLLLNFIGLIPAFATATANINLTASLAIIVLLIMVGGGILLNGPLGFWKAFMPGGVPWWLMPVMFLIEFASMFIKVGALALRLFANMLGGHIVIGILVGLVLVFPPYGFLALPLALFIYALEILVAFLQAYVFCLLSAIFIASMLHPEH